MTDTTVLTLTRQTPGGEEEIEVDVTFEVNRGRRGGYGSRCSGEYAAMAAGEEDTTQVIEAIEVDTKLEIRDTKELEQLEEQLRELVFW